jgi:excisionase family DNA binding protein
MSPADVVPPPLATTEQIAEYCGVTVATVYRWSSRGGGPRILKVGRHLRARWSDLEAWLDSTAKDA